MTTRVFVLVCWLFTATTLPAQLDWRALPSPRAGYQHAMAYDPSRGRIVMFGGFTGTGLIQSDETWEWTGSRWLPREVPGPERRHGAGMAWDPHSGEVLLFGGMDYDWAYAQDILFGDTWSWNGQRWRRLSPPRSPSPRSSVAMGNDPRTGEIVMFGGVTSTGFFSTKSDETWTWNGATWILQTPATRPPASYRASLVPSPIGSRLLMLGGLSASQFDFHGDTMWEWDGLDWSRVAVRSTVYPQTIYCAAHDPVRGRVLTLEHPWSRYPPRMWSWDGLDWSEILPTSTAFADWPANFDEGPLLNLEPGRQRILRFGGWDANGLANGDLLPKRATWAFDLWSERWSIVNDHAWLPAGQYGVVHDANRGRELFVGGYSNTRTWAYDDGEFGELGTSFRSWVGFNGMLECHYASGLVVVHGSNGDVLGRLDDRTWLFDGSQWSWRRYTVAPDPYLSGGVSSSYDPAARRILMWDESRRRLWSFDPSSGWQDLGPGPAMVGRAAFDAARGRLVLASWSAPSPGRIFEWDGQSWTEVFPANPLPALGGCFLEYVPELGGVVCVGLPRWLGGYFPDGTWLWDGVDWRQLPVQAMPYHVNSSFNLRIAYMSYDPEQGRLLAFFDGDVNMPAYALYGPTLSVDQPYPHPGDSMTFGFADATQANRQWLLGLSLSDRTGIPLLRHPFGIMRRYPLDADDLLIATLTHLRGRLDANGNGSFTVAIPNDPSLIDLTFHAAAVTLDQTWFGTISNQLDCEVVR
ncbi:MAG: hypothetical protein IPM29_05135 [Planctomycetes bacterium]|nr:hypothetical protein [Planctomycetota bacterium]